MVWSEGREDRERRLVKEVEEVQVEAARVGSSGKRGLREGGPVRAIKESEQTRDDAFDVVRAHAELVGNLLVGETAPNATEYFALAFGQLPRPVIVIAIHFFPSTAIGALPPIALLRVNPRV